METVYFKLKQASAILGMGPKELQNLVQLGVLQPPQRGGVFVFDRNLLCTARVALYLKRAFGAKSESLSNYVRALVSQMELLRKAPPDYVLIVCRVRSDDLSVEIKIPFRSIVENLEERIRQLPLFQDLPRGRKRPGWKKEILAAFQEASSNLRSASPGGIAKTIGAYRSEKRSRLEVTVVAAA